MRPAVMPLPRQTSRGQHPGHRPLPHPREQTHRKPAKRLKRRRRETRPKQGKQPRKRTGNIARHRRRPPPLGLDTQRFGATAGAPFLCPPHRPKKAKVQAPISLHVAATSGRSVTKSGSPGTPPPLRKPNTRQTNPQGPRPKAGKLRRKPARRSGRTRRQPPARPPRPTRRQPVDAVRTATPEGPDGAAGSHGCRRRRPLRTTPPRSASAPASRCARSLRRSSKPGLSGARCRTGPRRRCSRRRGAGRRQASSHR